MTGSFVGGKRGWDRDIHKMNLDIKKIIADRRKPPKNSCEYIIESKDNFWYKDD